MKILFAVSNENIAEAIKREYQNNYKAQLLSKNVYYFNAIIKELQLNKTYDVAIISEDLEPFANNNYDTIDKFLSDKLATIREYAVNQEGNPIPIIFIATDRHMNGDFLTTNLYKIGIYNALIGTDRSIENVCTLMFHPRNKQEAKAYYRVDAEIDRTPSEDEVCEEEIKNILQHYKNLGKAEERYVDSFNDIASQYTDAQLKVIIRFLPIHVKAVLEAKSPKYQSLTTFANNYNANATHKIDKKISENQVNEKDANVEVTNNRVLEQISSVRDNANVIIPNAMNLNRVRKVHSSANPNQVNENAEQDYANNEDATIKKTLNIETQSGVVMARRKNDVRTSDMWKEMSNTSGDLKNVSGSVSNVAEQPKMVEKTVETAEPATISETENETIEEPSLGEKIDSTVKEDVPQVEPVAIVKRGRGRPKKNAEKAESEDKPQAPKRGRGRPRKVVAIAEEEKNGETPEMSGITDIDVQKNQPEEQEVILPGFQDDVDNEHEDDIKDITENVAEGITEDVVLPGFGDVSDEEDTENGEYSQDNMQVEEESTQNIENSNNESLEYENETAIKNDGDNGRSRMNNSNNFGNFANNTNIASMTNSMSEKQNTRYENIEYLIPADTKVATFFGTSKSGVSFLVNNLAQMLSSFSINVAVLDLTKNKNSYYIYTNNEDNLRTVASNSIYNLIDGEAKGIKVNKNLTIYTALPTDTETFYEADKVIKTLIDNHSVILIDADYDTPVGYFDNSTDLFMVQNMDILTMQPLTTFLKELKAKNILKTEKLRLVVNMETRIKGINPDALLGALSTYKDPGMEYMVDLYGKGDVKLFTVPFDVEAYSKYLGSIAECKISLTGYSKNILTSLKEIAAYIYPIINGNKNKKSPGYMSPSLNNYGVSPFNGDVNNTLNQMKNRY